MKRQYTPIVLAACLVAAPFAYAKKSTPTEYRGYTACVKAAHHEADSLVAGRSYFIDKHSDKLSYYINGHARVEGHRAAVKIACDTNRVGTKVAAIDVSEGRFVQDRGNVRIEVASN